MRLHNILIEIFLSQIVYHYIGIGNTVNGLIGGLLGGIADLLNGLLGFSRSGDLISLHTSLGTLIQKLPSEIKSGGQKVTLATMQTVLNMITDLIKTLGQGKTKGVADILNDLTLIIQILQDNVTNAGARSILSNIYIELTVLLNNLQTSGIDTNSIISVLKSVAASLQATIKGLQDNSNLVGLTVSGQRDLLQNIFYTFNLIQESLSKGQASVATSLLRQLSFLLDGLELAAAGSASANILKSISINLDLMINSSTMSFTNADILNFIKATANSLNLTFDLSGLTGTGKLIGGSTGDSAQYLQQISIVFNNLQNAIASNNLNSIQTLIFQLGNLNRH